MHCNYVFERSLPHDELDSVLNSVQSSVCICNSYTTRSRANTLVTCRPADLLEPELEKLEKEMAVYKQQDEDILSYALFPQVATDFFKYREAQQTKVDLQVADTKNGAYPV